MSPRLREGRPARYRRLPAVAAFGVAALVAVTGCAGRGGGTAPGAEPPPATTAPASPSAPATPGPATPTPRPTGIWRMLPHAPVPGSYHAASVWTGTEMIIHYLGGGSTGSMWTVDAAYNPTTNRWRMLPGSPYPVQVSEGGFRAVWTGTEMLTFGQSYAAFNPRTNRWRPIAAGPAGASVTVWTGRQVLMWGGGCCGESSAAGWAYDPQSNTWRTLPAAPLSGRHANGVWTGREMIVVGGTNDSGSLTDGAAYNPTSRTWRKLPSLPAPRSYATLTWTGTEVLLVGGVEWDHGTYRMYKDGFAYSPTTNRWRHLPDMAMPRSQHMAVWTGRQLLVWGGVTTPYDSRRESFATPPHGVAYTPATNQWSALPRAPLRGRTDAAAVWTGREMIIWGGQTADAGASDGAAYRPPV
ncbi:MAG TPA: kelch repeat-containing protein [Micromonosporaceae bacterium]|nr:kelch repeat-containing protein [Micromonosporaceae bacterium]